MKVLVVDDASFMRRVYSDLVKEKGHEVVGEASTGREAIENYKHLRPDLIIMDVVMPDATGLEAVKEIISYDPGAKIIIVTAAEDETIQADALALGARGLLMKPPNPDELGDIIERVVREAESEDPSTRMAVIYSYLVRELIQYVRNYFDTDKEKELEAALHDFVKGNDDIEMDKALSVKVQPGDPSAINNMLNDFLEAGRKVLSGSVGETHADELFREAFKLVYQQTSDDLLYKLEIMFPTWLESEVVRMERANWEAKLDMVKKNYGLEGGHIYLMEEPAPKEAYRIYSAFTLTGTPGLIISRTAPKEIKQKYKTGPGSMIWLTYNKLPDFECIEPTGPGLIYKRIAEFVKDKPNAIVMVDGLEYLISQTSFSGAQKLIQAIHDDVMLSEAIVIMPLDVDVLEQKQVHFLSRELKVLKPAKDKKE